MSHTIIGGTPAIRELWDKNPQCQCGHTWRSHWLKRAGGPCMSTCTCQEFVARAAERQEV